MLTLDDIRLWRKYFFLIPKDEDEKEDEEDDENEKNDEKDKSEKEDQYAGKDDEMDDEDRRQHKFHDAILHKHLKKPFHCK